MNTKIRTVLIAGTLSLCAVGLSAQSQTASPGPNSRNANVDREDPNKPDTPENKIPHQHAPGSGNNAQSGAAGSESPTGGDGTPSTATGDVTQPIQNHSGEHGNTAQDTPKKANSR